MQLIDIKNMPNFNTKVPNGADSVSRGVVFLSLKPNIYNGINVVECVKHGAMNAVSQGGKIWRCLTCNEGGFLIREN